MSSKRLEQLQNLLKDDPTDSFLLFAIAKEYESWGKLKQALEHYLTIKEQDPDYIGLYYHLGKLYEELEEFDKALEAYTIGMETAQTQGDTHAYGELRGAKEMLEL